MSKIERLLRRSSPRKARYNAALMLAGVTEHVLRIIMDQVIGVTIDTKQRRLTPRHLSMAINDEDEFSEFLENVIIPQSGRPPNIHPFLQRSPFNRRPFNRL